MRVPLRYQLLLPWLAVTLASVGALSMVGAYLASSRVSSDLQTSLQNIARTLVDSRFPIEDRVLRQASGLSGARFSAVDEAGYVRAQSHAGMPLSSTAAISQPSEISLAHDVAYGNELYFHNVVLLDRRPFGGQREYLHIYYPERQLREARWQAVWPPLLAGAVASGLALVVTAVLAQRLTRPIELLGKHAEQIALGNFEQTQIPKRDDEIRDLALSINRMTEMLARYEAEIRRSERLSTLGQLGGAIAHQLRNAVTGCRMALDLHRAECNVAADDDNETLSVATRQLILMETYLQRFMMLGRPGMIAHRTVDLRPLVEQTIPLLKHRAAHLCVTLAVEGLPQAIDVIADPQAVEQSLINLVLNAIEAASAVPPTSDSLAKPKSVTIRLETSEQWAIVDVLDSGTGIAQRARSQLFEPFSTTKADGIGLGLATARTLIRQQHGEIELIAEASETCFRIRLPLASKTAPPANSP